MMMMNMNLYWWMMDHGWQHRVPATGFSSPALALWFTYQQVLKESNYIIIYCHFFDIFCRCNVSYGHLFSVWAVRFLSFALSFFCYLGCCFFVISARNGRVSEQVQHRTCTFSRCLVISWHFLLFIWSSFRHFPFFGAWHLRQSLKISHRNMSNPTDT